MKQIAWLIISPIITYFLGILTKLVRDKIRIRKPLGIRVDSKHLDFVRRSGHLSKDRDLTIRMPIIFSNNIPVKFDTSLIDLCLNPTDENRDLEFNISVMDQSGKAGSRFVIEPSNVKTHYLNVIIKSVSKDFEWKELISFLRKLKKDPTLKFKYVVAIDSIERKFEREIRDFYKNLINLMEKF